MSNLVANASVRLDDILSRTLQSSLMLNEYWMELVNSVVAPHHATTFLMHRVSCHRCAHTR